MADPVVSLRPWHVDDSSALVTAWHDPEILAGSTPPNDRSLGGAQRWIEGCGVREQRLLAIDRVISVDGECVGEVGISDIDQRRRAALIGWWVAADHRGNGYGATGVAAMVDLLLDPSHPAGVAVLVAQITETNLASVRVAERAGFELLRTGDGAEPHVYLRRA